MKKQHLLSGALCALLLSLSACSNEDDFQTGISTEDVNHITMIATDFEFPTTRTDFVIGENGAAFKWAANDTVGIFPNEGSQVYFPMTSGAGTNSASFTGGGWALKSSATYAAYYPFIGKMYLDQTKIPVSYTGQTQTGNGSTAHLGAYDFMAASATTAENGGVNFTFKHLGCLVQLKITVPNAGTLSSVTLSADEEVFVENGYIDLTATTPAVVSTQTASSLTIDLENVATTTANEIVTVYFMMAPMDMTGKTLTLKFGDTEKTVEAKNFEAGKAYQLATPLKTFEPTAVDLGLSVKWASCNVGAESPEEYGNYFAWGEIKTKSFYYESNSVTWKKTFEELMSSGIVDSDGNLTAAYDASTANWGNSWRMPTRDEIKELLINCTCKWTTYNGVNGQFVTGPNGNSIFLPAAGFRYGTGLYDSGSYGSYWFAMLDEDYSIACYVDFGSVGVGWGYNGRWLGFTIRPVANKS